MYSNAGGPRMGSYIDSVSQTMFGDLPPEEVLQFHYRVMNYDEAPLGDVRHVGLRTTSSTASRSGRWKARAGRR